MRIRQVISLAAQVTCAAGFLLACASSLGQPADKIIGSSGRQVELLSEPGAPQIARKIDATGFPWPIIEAKGDFYRIHIDGKDYWVDGMNVSVQRQSGAKCTPRPSSAAKYEVIAGLPGAGENVCK